MSYLISVIVPTKNRYYYLKYLIRLIVGFKLEDIELVIQDNSDDNKEIIEFLLEINNNNIKYYYSNEKLTMSANAELAVLHSTGEYVCFIGDDDGVCRNIVDCVKWMKKNNIEAVRSDSAFFNWEHGIILSTSKRAITFLDVKKELKNLIEKGMMLGLVMTPILYHGIVKRDIITNIYKNVGTLFPGCPPDISSSVNLCFFVKRYCSVNIPVIINGASSMTGGGVLKMGGIVDLKKVSFISQEDIDNWEKTIPPIWCGPYAWPNSGIKTLKYLKKDDLISNINFDYFLAFAVLRPKAFKYSYKFVKNKILFIYYIFKIYSSIYSKKLYRKINYKNIKRIPNIKNIVEAEAYFSIELNRNDLFSC
jgi:glycosyltransferase involved in cell wall biosynthesis